MVGRDVADILPIGKRVLEGQPFSKYLGARLKSLERGFAEITLANTRCNR